MHSHVLLEESLISMTNLRDNDFTGKVSVITAPCWQYVNKHRTLSQKQPDYTFTDISMATKKIKIFFIFRRILILNKSFKNQIVKV